MSVLFDTLAFARRLTDAGVPERQAEAHAEAIAAAIGDDIVRRKDLEPLATKADLAALERRIDVRLAALEHRMDVLDVGLEHRMGTLRVGLEHRMGALQVELEHLMGAPQVELER